MMIRIINPAAIFIIAGDFSVHSNNDHLVQIGVALEISIVWNIVVRARVPAGQ